MLIKSLNGTLYILIIHYLYLNFDFISMIFQKMKTIKIIKINYSNSTICIENYSSHVKSKVLIFFINTLPIPIITI